MSYIERKYEFEIEWDFTFFIVDGGIAGFMVHRDGLYVDLGKLKPETLGLLRDVCIDHLGAVQNGCVNVKDFLELPFSMGYEIELADPRDRNDDGEVNICEMKLDDFDFYDMLQADAGLSDTVHDWAFGDAENHFIDMEAERADWEYDRRRDDKLTGDA